MQALGAEIVYTSRRPAVDLEFRFLPLRELLAAAHVVSLHLPLNPETAGLIDAAALAAMKPHAILINTARGGLVDEPALFAALSEGRLRGAGLDVFADEPVPPDNPLLRLPNLVVTPHLAWLTAETLARSLAVIGENCRRLRDGEPLVHRVI